MRLVTNDKNAAADVKVSALEFLAELSPELQGRLQAQ